MITTLLFIFFTYLYAFSSVGLTNSVDAPQYRLTQSIVDDHSFYIDNHLYLTWPDISFYNDHYFSGRGPGESFLAIPFYCLSKLFLPIIRLPYNGMNPGIDVNSGLEASVSIMNSIFGALAVVFIFKISKLICHRDKYAIISALLFGLGTLLWKYSSIFYRHSLCLFFMLGATYIIINLLVNFHHNLIHILALGFFLSFSFFVEPTSIVFIFTTLVIYSIILLSHHQNFLKILNSFIVIGFTIFFINIPIFIYNQKVFGSIFNTGWQGQVRNSWLADRTFTFSTPLVPSVLTNFFSPNIPIPQSSFSSKLLENETIKQDQGFYYVTSYRYKGIFFQSPYLFLILFSIFIIKNKKIFLSLITLAFSSILLQLKYVVFYSPNSYDTRFFLYFVGIITPLISVVLVFFNKVKSLFLKIILWIVFAILALISIYFSWVSEIENYAPHITGEKRVIVENLILNHYFSELAINTFPNIYNFQIITIFIIIALIIFFIIQLTLQKTSNKYLSSKNNFVFSNRFPIIK